MRDERPIPPAARRDPDAVEMARIWIAEGSLYCSIKIGMYEEEGIPEEKAWGTILADVARHIDCAISGEESGSRAVLKKIITAMLEELGAPTSDISGEFL